MASRKDTRLEGTNEDETIELTRLALEDKPTDYTDETQTTNEHEQIEICDPSPEDDVVHHPNTPIEDDPENDLTPNNENGTGKYERLHLGLVQTMIFKFSGNIKKQSSLQ